MTKTDLTDEALDALLRREFEGPVPDDGFSARVARALPPRSRKQTWPLPLAFGCGAVLAAAALTPAGLWAGVAREASIGLPGSASAALVAVAVGLGALCCAWALEESV